MQKIISCHCIFHVEKPIIIFSPYKRNKKIFQSTEKCTMYSICCTVPSSYFYINAVKCFLTTDYYILFEKKIKKRRKKETDAYEKASIKQNKGGFERD